MSRWKTKFAALSLAPADLASVVAPIAGRFGEMATLVEERLTPILQDAVKAAKSIQQLINMRLGCPDGVTGASASAGPPPPPPPGEPAPTSRVATAAEQVEQLDAVLVLSGHLRNTRSMATAGTQPWTTGRQVALLRQHGGRFPALAAAVPAAGDPSDRGRDHAREFGLARILDGLEVLIAERTTTPGRPAPAVPAAHVLHHRPTRPVRNVPLANASRRGHVR